MAARGEPRLASSRVTAWLPALRCRASTSRTRGGGGAWPASRRSAGTRSSRHVLSLTAIANSTKHLRGAPGEPASDASAHARAGQGVVGVAHRPDPEHHRAWRPGVLEIEHVSATGVGSHYRPDRRRSGWTP